MQKRQKAALWILATVFIFIPILFNLGNLYKVIPPGPSQPPSIDNIRGSSPIRFSVVAGEDDIIHLIWISNGNKLTYQKSADKGKSWTGIKVFDEFDSRLYEFPKLLAVGNKLVLLWEGGGNLYQQIGSDQDDSWGSKNIVMIRPNNVPVYTDTGYILSNEIEDMSRSVSKIFSAVSSYNSIYIVYKTAYVDEIYFSKSDDYGLHWYKPLLLIPKFINSGNSPTFTMAVNDENIYILYRFMGSPDSRIYFLRSTDGGDIWKDMSKYYDSNNELHNFSMMYQANKLPQLIANDTKLQLIFESKHLYYMFSSDNGLTWSTPYNTKISNWEEYGVFPDNSGSLLIPYISNRNQEMDWRGYLPEPLRVMTTWDDSPNRDNNDLYCSTIKDGVSGRTKRLTHQSSYVQRSSMTGFSSFTCLNVSEKTMIFWAGKRKVGKYAINPAGSSPKFPFEIFIKEIK